MTVFEYRQKHPKCDYCYNRIQPFETCQATGKIFFPWTAKKCPCYRPKKWGYEILEEIEERKKDK